MNAVLNIEEQLETLDGSKNVYRVIDAALESVKYFQLDMTCEIRKLKTMKCWAYISVKVLDFLAFKNMGLTFDQINTINIYMR